MRKLTGGDLKELGLLKHYRIIRRWATKTNGITDADLELLNLLRLFRSSLGSAILKTAALHTLGTIEDGTGCLKKAGLLNGEVITESDKSYSIYKISFKCKCLIQQMYRIMLGEEDIPTSTRRNPVMKKDII